MLFRQQGGSGALSEWPAPSPRNAALTLHYPVTHPPCWPPSMRLYAGRRIPGALRPDYRDTEVWVVYPVMNTDWYLLAKIDKAELYQATFKESVWIGLIGLLVLFITNAGIILLRQHPGCRWPSSSTTPSPSGWRRCNCSPPSPTARKMPSLPRTGGQIHPVQPRRQPVCRQIRRRGAGPGRFHGHLPPPAGPDADGRRPPGD